MRTPRLPVVLRISAAVLMACTFLSAAPISGAADEAWQGEYFANTQLAGNPAVTRADRNIDFDWGWGAPAEGIPADYFSARWTRKVDLAEGWWNFNVSVDDGVRLYVDGQAIIDQWRITAPITYTSAVSLTAGTHNLRVEYLENSERAQITVWWTPGEAPASSAMPALPHAGAWQGRYFKSRVPSGTPDFERDDANIYFDWGETGPGGSLGGQDYSVRWERKVNFPAGHYRFQATADDGVRVWFDWAAVIDQFHNSAGDTYTFDMDVAAGEHDVVVEYYQGAGDAKIHVSWWDTSVNWVANLYTCMRPWGSWIKVYRLTPNQQWEDLRAAGYGPLAQDGSLPLFAMPIDPTFGWDGQPYKVELWEDGHLVLTQGDFLAGQPVFRLLPGADVHTSWPCGANIPQ